MRVELTDSRPNIWRRLSVAADTPLSLLHEFIQIAMGWTNSHLYEFSRERERFGPPLVNMHAANDTMDATSDATVQVRQFLAHAGSQLTYLYDFGDDWVHLITSEGSVDAPDDAPPYVLAGERACPPEDCGGIHRFTDLLQAATAKSRKKKRSNEDELGDFDPAHFDRDRVNEKLLVYYKTFVTGERYDGDIDNEDEDDAGLWSSPDPADVPVPLDNMGNPVLYDPNDSRGPDPLRWSQLDEDEHVQAILAYHDIMNETVAMPQIHATAHALVEHHLLSPQLPSAKRALKRAIEHGLSRHDAIHALSQVALSTMSEHSAHRSASKPGIRSRQRSTASTDAALDMAYRKFDAKKWLRAMESEDE